MTVATGQSHSLRVQSSNREDLPIEEEPATSSRAKRKPTQTQNPKEQSASKKLIFFE